MIPFAGSTAEAQLRYLLVPSVPSSQNLKAFQAFQTLHHKRLGPLWRCWALALEDDARVLKIDILLIRGWGPGSLMKPV